LPLLLFGQSMGSFAAQAVITQHSPLYTGVVLSGSTVLDVTAYPDARHEILDETNRDEVNADLVAWLIGHSPA
jgi:alpha-beta hydrolase superfamily lysophospholipase